MPPLAQTILTHVIGGFINKQNLKRKSTGVAAVLGAAAYNMPELIPSEIAAPGSGEYMVAQALLWALSAGFYFWRAGDKNGGG